MATRPQAKPGGSSTPLSSARGRPSDASALRQRRNPSAAREPKATSAARKTVAAAATGAQHPEVEASTPEGAKLPTPAAAASSPSSSRSVKFRTATDDGPTPASSQESLPEEAAPEQLSPGPSPSSAGSRPALKKAAGVPTPTSSGDSLQEGDSPTSPSLLPTNPRARVRKAATDGDILWAKELPLPGIGARIRFVLNRQEMSGTVSFAGETEFSAGNWVGVTLDVPEGKNDGTVLDKRYFTCPPQHGLFIRPKTVLAVEAEPPTIVSPPATPSSWQDGTAASEASAALVDELRARLQQEEASHAEHLAQQAMQYRDLREQLRSAQLESVEQIEALAGSEALEVAECQLRKAEEAQAEWSRKFAAEVEEARRQAEAAEGAECRLGRAEEAQAEWFSKCAAEVEEARRQAEAAEVAECQLVRAEEAEAKWCSRSSEEVDEARRQAEAAAAMFAEVRALNAVLQKEEKAHVAKVQCMEIQVEAAQTRLAAISAEMQREQERPAAMKLKGSKLTTLEPRALPAPVPYQPADGIWALMCCNNRVRS